MTNLERVRNMNAGELAKWAKSLDCEKCIHRDVTYCYNSCIEGMTKWLESEAPGEALKPSLSRGESRVMSRGEAFQTIGKHIFESHKTYGEPTDYGVIILADNPDDAKAKAKEFWDSPFVMVKPVSPTKDTQVYVI